MSRRPCSRRQALGLLAGAIAFEVTPQGTPPSRGRDSLVGDLMDPARAGRPQSRITKYENDPFVVGVEQELRCTCGCNLSVYTCRTTDFTCETSPAMHQRVVELVDQKKSGPEILDAFVAQYGEVVLMAPIKTGFNLAGYVVPGILITLAGGVLAWVIARKTRRPVVATVGADASAGGAGSDAEQARLRAEMEELEL